jgi:hypothetical protein
MSKNSEIKFVGQPILKQILDLINVVNLGALIQKYNSDRYYKLLKSVLNCLHFCLVYSVDRLDIAL